MKKISINSLTRSTKSSIYTKEKKHSVALGNGKVFHINNIINAKQFLAETNRFLNLKLHEINDLYIDLNTHANSMWFSMDDRQDRAFLSDIEVFMNSRRLAVERGHFANGNHFIFRHLENCLNSLIRIAIALNKVLKKTGRASETYRIRSIEDRIHRIKYEINKYGNDLLLDFDSSDLISKFNLLRLREPAIMKHATETVHLNDGRTAEVQIIITTDEKDHIMDRGKTVFNLLNEEPI